MPTRNVLIVDPNAAFSQILQESLEQVGGYAVSVANTGQAAVALVQRETFDLALVDVLLAAFNRFSQATLRRKHVRRTARQAMKFVAHDG